jgi:hypothetical protein
LHADVVDATVEVEAGARRALDDVDVDSRVLLFVSSNPIVRGPLSIVVSSW